MLSLINSLDNNDSPKVFSEGARRICSAEDTLSRVKKFFPIMGITRVANITGLDHLGIPVYVACRPNSRSLSVSQGKGYSHAAAQASAIMESVESYHAETILANLRLCSQNEIIYTHDCVDTSLLPRHKESDFTADKRILWIESFDLLTKSSKWVPYESTHLDYRTPFPTGHGSFISSSNGLSSGNTYQEAILHGICELIERDSLTLWSLSTAEQQYSRKVSLDTIKDKHALEIINRFKEASIDIGIWDITSDLGIPAFLCRAISQIEPDISGLRPASGMGCHLSREVALLRALTEAAQSRLTFISGARDDLSREDYQKFLSMDEFIKWREIILRKGKRDYQLIASPETQTFNEDISLLLSRLQENKIEEVVVINLTKEEFNIPVTKVIIPGLESFPSGKPQILGERAGRILSTNGDVYV